MISDKRAVYLGCFIHAALYMPVRVGSEDGDQYITTQVEAVWLDDFLLTFPKSKIKFQKGSGAQT